MTHSLFSRTSLRLYLPAALLVTGLGILSATAITAHPKAAATPLRAVKPTHVLLSSTSSVKTLPHIYLKAGHTYQLSPDRMGRIVGASDPQLAPGTTTQIPASQGTTGDPASSGYWIIEAPDGTDYEGNNSSDEGWRAGGKTNSAITITVPRGAAPGGYLAFYCIKNIVIDGGYIVSRPPTAESNASGMTPEVMEPPGTAQSSGPQAEFNVD